VYRPDEGAGSDNVEMAFRDDCAADSWWCDWQTLIYDRKSVANVPQIPGGVTDRRRTTDGRCNPALLRPQMGYIMLAHTISPNIRVLLKTKFLNQAARVKNAASMPQILAIAATNWRNKSNREKMRHRCRRF
jgi:hypothetical protein